MNQAPFAKIFLLQNFPTHGSYNLFAVIVAFRYVATYYVYHRFTYYIKTVAILVQHIAIQET